MTVTETGIFIYLLLNRTQRTKILENFLPKMAYSGGFLMHNE